MGYNVFTINLIVGLSSNNLSYADVKIMTDNGLGIKTEILQKCLNSFVVKSQIDRNT